MAKKQQDSFKDSVLFAYVSMGILVLALMIGSFHHDARIKNLQEEIASMPHYECKTEYQSINISFSEFENAEYGLGNYDYLFTECFVNFSFIEGESLDIGNFNPHDSNMYNCFGYIEKEVCKLDKSVNLTPKTLLRDASPYEEENVVLEGFKYPTKEHCESLGWEFIGGINCIDNNSVIVKISENDVRQEKAE